MTGRRLSFVLVFTVFYEQLSWTPVLVILAATLGDPEVVAVAASAYSLANLGGNLGFGYLSDRVGRYRIAGAGLLAMAGTALLHIWAASPAMLVGARFLHGLAIAAVAPAAFAVISDGAQANRRGEVMARAGLVIAFASMLAPAVTGRLSGTLGVLQAISIQAAVLALLGTLTLISGLRTVRPLRERSEPPAAGEALHLLSSSLAITAAVVAFTLMFGQNVLFYALPLKARALGLGPAVTGGILSAFAFGAIAAFVPPLSRSVDRWGRRLPLLIGLLLIVVALLTLNQSVAVTGLTAGMVVYGLGFGLVFPAVSALTADASGQENRGMAYGVLTAAFSAGAITGPLVTRALSWVAPPFAITAVCVAAGAAATALLFRLPAPAARRGPGV